MTNAKALLLIPVENQVRELDPKLLLACVAARRGFSSMIGSRREMEFNIDAFPQSIYLSKSMTIRSLLFFRVAKKFGHEIITWDEEALVHLPPETYFSRRLNPSAIRYVSHLFAWGTDNRELWRQYVDLPDKLPIHITGNPRIDLMRPELREYYKPQVDALHERYGDFVLVNTNFGLVNHFYPDLGYLKKAVESSVPETVNPYDAGKGRHKLALFHCFQEMLPSLCAAVPDHTVILRPHPAENQEVWVSIAKRCPNLRVTSDGSITPWLMATKAVIANGCMTLVEAAVLGAPAVAYQPVISKEFDDDLPNSLSHHAFSTDELCAAIRAVIAGELGPFDPSVRRDILGQHIAALDGALAADRIIQVLEAHGYNKQNPPAVSSRDYIRGWAHNKLRTLMKRINMRRPGHRNNAAFHDHRFPEISVEEIMEQIARLGQLVNRFETIHVEQHSKHIFKISSTSVNGRNASP